MSGEAEYSRKEDEMRKKYGEHRYVHFICNGLTGFIEVEPCGGMWVNYAGERRGYGGLQGRLKHVVDHIMQQHGLMHH